MWNYYFQVHRAQLKYPWMHLNLFWNWTSWNLGTPSRTTALSSCSYLYGWRAEKWTQSHFSVSKSRNLSWDHFPRSPVFFFNRATVLSLLFPHLLFHDGLGHRRRRRRPRRCRQLLQSSLPGWSFHLGLHVRVVLVLVPVPQDFVTYCVCSTRKKMAILPLELVNLIRTWYLLDGHLFHRLCWAYGSSWRCSWSDWQLSELLLTGLGLNFAFRHFMLKIAVHKNQCLRREGSKHRKSMIE